MKSKHILAVVVALALVGPQVLRVESAWGDNPPPATQPSTAISDLLTTTDGYLKANPIAADSLAAMGSGVNALLASEIASGAVEWGTWSTLARRLAPHLSAADKTAWADKVKTAFASGGSGLTYPGVAGMASSLKSLGDAQGKLLTSQWMGATNAWQSFDEKRLTALAEIVSSDGAGGSAGRQQLSSFIQGRYLVDATSVKSVSLSNWITLGNRLGKDLAPEAKTHWVNQIRGAYADSTSLPTIQETQIQGLAASLGILGDTNTKTLMADWVIASTDWQKRSVANLGRLAVAVSTSPAAKNAEPNAKFLAAKRQVLEYVQSSILPQAAKVQEAGPAAWLVMYQVMRGDLTAAEKTNWTAKLQAVYGAAGSLDGMNLYTATQATTLLGALQVYSGNDLMVKYFLKSDAWKQATPLQLAGALEFLGAKDPLSGKARARLRQHLQATYLSDIAKMRAQSMSTWNRLRILFEDAPDTEKTTWSTALAQAFATTDDQIAALPISVVIDLVEKAQITNVQQAAHSAWIWITQAPNKAQWQEHDLVRVLAVALRTADKSEQEKQALVAAMEPIWVTANPTVRSDYDRALLMTQIYSNLGQTSKAQWFLQRCCDLLAGSTDLQHALTMDDLGTMAEDLIKLQMVGKEREHTGLATALGWHARQGTLRSHWSEPLGQALAGPQSRQTLAAGLNDSGGGSPRVEVAHILTLAHLAAGELPAWKAQVDQKLTDTQVIGDTKALWLVIRGFVAEAGAKPRPNVLWRKSHLDQAWAQAQSDAVKLTIVYEMADYFRRVGSLPSALGFMDSIAGQFTQAPLQQKLASLRQQVAADHDARQVRLAQDQRAQELAQKQARLTHLKSTLKRALANQNQAAAAQLKEQIRLLQEQLAQ